AYNDNQQQDASKPKTTKTLNPDWFKQLQRHPTSDHKWNKRQVVLDQLAQPWFNKIVSAIKDPLTFNDLMATPIDFSNFAKNRLKLNKITKADLVRPFYNLLKGTCQSSVELEYNMEECFKALTDKLDWENPEGDQCSFDLIKLLPLKGHLGHLTVAPEYFFNNDLEYLKSIDSERKYTTSITKTKAVRSQLNRFSKHDVYSPLKILSVVSVKVDKLHGYRYLEEIVVRRTDRQRYKFKEGDFVNLHLNDIEDMLLLVVQHKLFHLDGDVIVDLAVALQPYTRSFEPLRVVYEDLSHQKRLMRADELYKFLDGRLKKVCDTLHHRLRKRKWSAMDQKRSGLMVDLIDKHMLERRILRNLERLVSARELEMDYRLM
ncbi:hypothetical protein Tco_1306305, partial [Tanacetum coccineum]